MIIFLKCAYWILLISRLVVIVVFPVVMENVKGVSGVAHLIVIVGVTTSVIVGVVIAFFVNVIPVELVLAEVLVVVVPEAEAAQAALVVVISV
jgi:hypothetical protein